MYKGKYLNNGSVPAAASVPTTEEIDKEALLEQTLAEHKAAPQAEPEAEPVYESPDVPESPAPKKKKSMKGTIIFYSIYGVFVVAAVAAIFFALSPLKEWLIKFEASQPETKCQEIFNQYFKDPDWAILYDMAGIEDTEFEGQNAFVQYMTAKTESAENPELTYQETAAGLSRNKKYILKLDDEKIGTFYLEPSDSTEDGITNWNLGDVELYYSRTESVIVELLPGQTVTVNGVALDDSYIIRTTSTKAENYLETYGLHGYRSQQMQVTGLLVEPQVLVTDANGDTVPLTTDDESGILCATAQAQNIQIPDEHKEIVQTFGRNYGLFAIRKIGSGTLAKYMYNKAQCFKDVINTPPFLQKFVDYKINDAIVKDYYAYSDSLFSARILLTMDVHAAKGNIKHFEMDTTFFFEKMNGKFLVVDKTNVDITEPVDQVRLRFMNGDTQVDSYMIDSNSAKIATPLVNAPSGKILKGWAIQEADENGHINMTILFTPDENGTATVTQALEPMVLHAVFGIEE